MSLKNGGIEYKQLIVFATESLLNLAKKPWLKTKDLRLNLAHMGLCTEYEAEWVRNGAKRADDELELE